MRRGDPQPAGMTTRNAYREEKMFTETEAIPTFPTVIWRHHVAPEVVARLKSTMGAKIDELLANRPPIGPRQGLQTDHNLHRLPEFEEFSSIVTRAGEGALDFLEVEYDAFEITGCWANINPPGTRHVAHQHPNNYLSGVYYLKAPEGAPSIAFLDPRSHVHIISPKVRRDNNYNSGRVNIDVREGMLIIFPAWLVHEVGENRTDESRISISFNLMFSSFTEKYSPPKWKGTLVPEE